MSLLSPTDQQTLRDMFADMTQQVTILFFTQTIGCETCDETKKILAELTELTDQIVVEEVNLVLDGGRAADYGIDRAPGLVLLAGGQDTRIRMLGAPAGYDFMSLVDAILAVSGASDAPLSHGEPGAAGAGHRAAEHRGVRHPDLTPLSAGRRPRKPNGVSQPAHHGDVRAGHRVLRPGAEVSRDRRAEDGGQRRDRDSRRACPRGSSCGRCWG